MLTIQWDGKPINTPGIYHGMPLERYHAADACVGKSISSSGLKKIFLQSPAHYWIESPLNPKRIDTNSTEAMTLGRAAHLLLLGEPDFKSQFVIRPEVIGGEKWQGNRKVCKVWLEQRRMEGLTVITPDQAEAMKGISESLARHPLIAKARILNGLIEHSFAWIDQETKIWLRARPDAIPADSTNFVDLKSTSSVDEDYLSTAIYDYGYFMQAALVAEACETLIEEKLETFTLVFVETKPPYCVAIRTLKEGDIERGRRANRVALRKFAECLKRKEWPGPGGAQTDASFIEMPVWAQKRIDDKLALEGM